MKQYKYSTVCIAPKTNYERMSICVVSCDDEITQPHVGIAGIKIGPLVTKRGRRHAIIYICAVFLRITSFSVLHMSVS